MIRRLEQAFLAEEIGEMFRKESAPDRTRTCDPGLEDRGAIQVSYGRADHSRSAVRR